MHKKIIVKNSSNADNCINRLDSFSKKQKYPEIVVISLFENPRQRINEMSETEK